MRKRIDSYGVYECSDCHKQTRNTQGEGDAGMCRTCYQAAEAYNSVQDGDWTDEDFTAYLLEIGYQGHDFNNQVRSGEVRRC